MMSGCAISFPFFFWDRRKCTDILWFCWFSKAELFSLLRFLEVPPPLEVVKEFGVLSSSDLSYEKAMTQWAKSWNTTRKLYTVIMVIKCVLTDTCDTRSPPHISPKMPTQRRYTLRNLLTSSHATTYNNYCLTLFKNG